jgi:hypothetical protein
MREKYDDTTQNRLSGGRLELRTPAPETVGSHRILPGATAGLPIALGDITYRGGTAVGRS